MMFGEMLRRAHAMAPWSMNGVMLLGILVALIKIAELATVEPGVRMYAMGALVILFAAILVSVDPREIWPDHRRVGFFRAAHDRLGG